MVDQAHPFDRVFVKHLVYCQAIHDELELSSSHMFDEYQVTLYPWADIINPYVNVRSMHRAHIERD